MRAGTTGQTRKSRTAGKIAYRQESEKYPKRGESPMGDIKAAKKKKEPLDPNGRRHRKGNRQFPGSISAEWGGGGRI